MAVQMEKLEGEIGRRLAPAQAYRLGKRVDVRHTARVGHGDLAVQHQQRQPGQLLEQFAEQRGAVVPLRLMSLRSPPTITTSRCPSCFTSCSQPPPAGGSALGERICR